MRFFVPCFDHKQRSFFVTLMIAAIFFLGCSVQKHYSVEANPVLKWNVAESAATEGVILLTAGMNNKPEIMAPLAIALQAMGFHTAVVPLRGQTIEQLPPKASEVAQLWQREFIQASLEAGTRFPTLPVYGLGYSLGATVIAATIEETKIVRLVFLAPAISLRAHTQLVRVVTPLSAFGLRFPSWSHPDYRAHSFPALWQYDALFRLADSLTDIPESSRLHRLPALVAMSKEDELVSWDGTNNWITKNRLQQWQIEAIRPKSSLEDSFAHLVVDEPSLGTTEWVRLTKRIGEFFRQKDS